MPPAADSSHPRSAAPPRAARNILFIHHSVGGQWLADPGAQETTTDARRSLHATHPNGGGLRRRLESQGYSVHEASYGSDIGQHTDLFDWAPKFRGSMSRILATRRQDEPLEAGLNQIVMFKSCYPNNAFEAAAVTGAQDPRALTPGNARTAFAELRAALEQRPDVLFVYVTAPPLRDDSGAETAWKSLAKRALGREPLRVERQRSAAMAREFNDWLLGSDGWLAGYPHHNIAVFDYFGLLTRGASFLAFASNGGTDNHPTAAAQALATERFVQFLERAVRVAGLAA